MELVDGQLILSATDLINYLECGHLTWLDRERAEGLLSAEPKRLETAELVATKGDEHEVAYLEGLKTEYGEALVEIATDGGRPGLERAVAQTAGAIAAGAPIIFQGSFLSGQWRGHADFLRRIDRSLTLGDWSYEAIDTKLARSVKPYFVLQLCFYSELLAELQGAEPEHMYVVLGTGEEKSLRYADFSAYYRRLKAEFASTLSDGLADIYPEPVAHCGLCRWSDVCDARWERDDHLSLVARLARTQLMGLTQAGITTVAELARAAPEQKPSRIGRDTFDRLRQQARLQVAQRESGKPSYELLDPQLDPDAVPHGFARLPRPSDGDLFFDIEGDPFCGEQGLEYLWGISYRQAGVEHYQAFWGKDSGEEKRAFEQFIDFVIERRRRFPDMHVYHYAPYEPSAMKRLMGVHGTREDEVDQLLRDNVLVDLYRVVEQALRISQPSYSLKKVEVFYMPDREATVTDGEDSILKFEEWLATGEDSLLQWIERYNEEDCVSTLRLLDWLVELRGECELEYATQIPWLPQGSSAPAGEEEKKDDEVERLQTQLLADIPDNPSDRTEEGRGRWLLAQMLDYHRRERKPFWWEYFDRLQRTAEELVEADSETIGGLEPTDIAPRTDARSLIHTLRFPPQEHKVAPGAFADPFSAAIDTATGLPAPFSVTKFNVERVIDQEGLVEIRRQAQWCDRPLPRALMPCTVYPTDEHEVALREVAEMVLAHGIVGDGPYRAVRDILIRALPRTAAVPIGEQLQDGPAHLERIKEVVQGLDHSYLFIQGPPGSGKTYTGAQLVLDLLSKGYSVGVASNSHKAINNLLGDVEKHAADINFRGLKKSSSTDQDFESELEDPLIGNSRKNADFTGGHGLDLIAGTAWLWCRQEMRQSVDYLVIDEAGQISLADALATGTASRNLVLLGDPLQLAQVSQGAHPDGSAVSVLEHLLGEDGTIPPRRGVFLDHTRRMHPDVCRFVSEAVYEGRLSAIEECDRQRIDADGSLTGTGVRAILIDHEGNTRSSPEEATRVAEEIQRMLGAAYTKANGATVPLTQDDFMVVSPYNAQVRCLRAELNRQGLTTVPVGTVDKFQGQEAAVVFFSMATSSGEEIPRNVEFLYSRNRLNVAVSRARCLAVLVASPKLLTTRCHTVEQMRLVNALCWFVEMAGDVR
jgi:predicted RecB family nuclease